MKNVRKSKKRIISIIVVMLMVFTMVPSMAFADDEYPTLEGAAVFPWDNDTYVLLHSSSAPSDYIFENIEFEFSDSSILDESCVKKYEDMGILFFDFMPKKSGTVEITFNYKGTLIFSTTATLTLMADGVYSGATTGTSDADMVGPLEEITLDGPADKTGYLNVYKDNKKFYRQGYRIAIKSDNTSVVKDDGDGAGNLIPVANGEANLYIYEENSSEGVSNLLYVIPVTVTGMETDAPAVEKQREPVTGAQTAGGSVELKDYAVNMNIANDTVFDNYIEGTLSTAPEFRFTLTSSGKGTAPATLQDLFATYKDAYFEALASHIQLTDANGDAVAAEVAIENFYQGNGNKYCVDLKVNAADLANNQAYKLTLTYGTPTLCCNWGGTALEWGTNEAVKKTVEYNFFTEKADFTAVIVDVIEDQTYTGEAVTPAVVVKDGETVLVEGTDYEVEYADNTAVGTATVTITGIGNYEGTQDVTFNIVPIDFADVTVDAIADQTATGSARTPDVVVKDGETVLVKDTDYTVDYKDNTAAGTATVTITGIGNYAGTKVVTFNIVAPEPPSEPEVEKCPNCGSELSDGICTNLCGCGVCLDANGLCPDCGLMPGACECYEQDLREECPNCGGFLVDGVCDNSCVCGECLDENGLCPGCDKTPEECICKDVKEDKDSSAQTGDESNMLPFFVLMMAAIAAAGAAVIRRKEN